MADTKIVTIKKETFDDKIGPKDDKFKVIIYKADWVPMFGLNEKEF